MAGANSIQILRGTADPNTVNDLLPGQLYFYNNQYLYVGNNDGNPVRIGNDNAVYVVANTADEEVYVSNDPQNSNPFSQFEAIAPLAFSYDGKSINLSMNYKQVELTANNGTANFTLYKQNKYKIVNIVLTNGTTYIYPQSYTVEGENGSDFAMVTCTVTYTSDTEDTKPTKALVTLALIS